MKPRAMTDAELQATKNLLNSQNQDFEIFLNFIGDYGESVIQVVLQKADLVNPEYTRGVGGGVTNILEAIQKVPEKLNPPTYT